ncbi:AP-5 complex subunit sigma-1-like [Oscarella lobularis]|uniref:AP-5 complex subunit sigma-1-like n=1 Tax=Oscarella lobularis TaxID=121494 RepID=UPI00331352C0
MVYAFLVHTVNPGPCRILFAAFYGCEDSESEIPDEKLRARRKEQLNQIAEQVQSEFSFRSSTTGTKYSGEGISDELLAVKETGFFRLASGCPFKESKFVLWMTQARCGYTIVMEEDENRILAENVLNLMLRLIDVYVKKQDETTIQILLKADKMASVVHLFLPNGQLQFINHRVVEQYQKELELLLSGK